MQLPPQGLRNRGDARTRYFPRSPTPSHPTHAVQKGRTRRLQAGECVPGRDCDADNPEPFRLLPFRIGCKSVGSALIFRRTVRKTWSASPSLSTFQELELFHFANEKATRQQGGLFFQGRIVPTEVDAVKTFWRNLMRRGRGCQETFSEISLLFSVNCTFDVRASGLPQIE